MVFDGSNTSLARKKSQGIRLPEGLTSGFFALEGRSLANRLSLLGDLAQHLAFVDGEGRVAGSWRKLFEAEPAFVLAQLISLDVHGRLVEFETALAQDGQSAEFLLQDVARRGVVWLDRLAAHVSADTALGARIRAFGGQSGTLDKLRLIAHHGRDDDGAWRDMLVQVLGGVVVVSRADDLIARARAERDLLRGAIAFVLNTIGDLQPLALRELSQRLEAGRIDPAMGLLLAELQAVELVGAEINRLPDRLVSFYFREVLGQAPRPAPAERVLLSFPAPTVPVDVPEKSPIQARQGDHEWRFVTESRVQMIPAQVTAQAILRYDLDPRIALSTTLGAISGLRAQFLPDPHQAETRGLFDPAVEKSAEVGIEIGSPLLWLAEGVRNIEIEFELGRVGAIAEGADFAALVAALLSDPELLVALDHPDAVEGAQEIAHRVQNAAALEGRAVSLEFLYEVLLRAPLPVVGLRALLGRVLAGILIEGKDWPSEEFLSVLDGRIAEVGLALNADVATQGAAPSLVEEVFRRNPSTGRFVYPPDDLFEMLLGDAFDLRLSTAEGEFRPRIFRARRGRNETGCGIGFQIKLDRADPPIAAWADAAAPWVRVTAAQAARVFPQSFFELYHIERVRIRVRAEGMQDLAGYGDDGRLDLAQSFMPFGIRPRDGASLSVLAPEMALKPVSDVSLALEWAELPGRGAGFQRHYAQYGQLIGVPTPKMKVEFRSADGWKPLTGGDDVDMIAVDAASTTMQPEWRFVGKLQSRAIPDGAGRVPELPASREQIRSGAVRLTLTDSLRGFLAEEYPAALVRALRPRLWSRLRPKFLQDLKAQMGRVRRTVPGVPSLPMTPFVPKIASLRLGYTAQAVIALNASNQARIGEHVAHITPFGRRALYPKGGQKGVSLLPERIGYGARFFQLSGEGAIGPVSLLFEIVQAPRQRVETTPRLVSWFYLGPEGWTPLPAAAMASDTTDGLSRTGIIMVDLPDDALPESEEMPGQGYWLAAVADWPDLDDYPLVRRAETNAVWAVSETLPDADVTQAQARDFAPSPSIPGLGQPEEVPSDRQVRHSETEMVFKARVSATLRHRGWAVTPQDVEDLVLEAFPEIFLAKCLAGVDSDGRHHVPGAITLVIVPRNRFADHAAPRPQLFDASLLRDVANFIQARLPIGARLNVRNPSYELLQVRAHVRFDAQGDDGARALRLRDYVARALSIWTASSDLGRFGWSLNVDALRADIAALPSVAAVTGFSVLQLVCDRNDAYHLFDSATAQSRDGGVRLASAEPWGLPLAARDHDFQVITDLRHREPRPTGIGALRVGDMLIVNKRESV